MATVIIFFLLVTTTKSIAQQTLVDIFCHNTIGNFTANSTYQSNLNQALSNILSLANATADPLRVFYNSSSGNASDEAHAIALCRGDVGLARCRDCLAHASTRLTQDCPYRKQAVVWYDYCFLRYSNASILGVMAFDTYREPRILVNVGDVSSSSADAFSRELWSLLGRLRSQASGGGSLRKFATGNASVASVETLYGLAQCTPDLSEEDCESCLEKAEGTYRGCCGGKIGGQVISVSCSFRYEISPFYDINADDVAVPSSPPLQPPSLSPSLSPGKNTTNAQGKEENNNTTKIVIIVVSSTAGLVGLIVAIYAYLTKLKREKKKTEIQARLQSFKPVEEAECTEALHLQYSFETIRVATDDFREQNKLGHGGFGSVYRGKLPNGQDIAVKRLSSGSCQGDMEFKNEVLLVAKLQHRNLVRLIGLCLEGSERILIYEFVTNSSLDNFIFDQSKRADFSWDRRYKIIGGIARGLLYLHEDSRLRIIHRDLKPSNILLDKEMNPKIADFGLARLVGVDQTQGNTSRIAGTYGYMAPEYVMRGHFSVKSDVYSFGVLLLEIVSGQKNNIFHQGENVQDLLSYAWRNWREGNASNIVDPLMRHGSTSEIIRCIHIALLCVQDNVSNRPTMNTVILMLNSNSLSLPVPLEPAFFMHRNIESDMSLPSSLNSRVTGESDHSKSQSADQAYSTNEASITDLYPR